MNLCKNNFSHVHWCSHILKLLRIILIRLSSFISNLTYFLWKMWEKCLPRKTSPVMSLALSLCLYLTLKSLTPNPQQKCNYPKSFLLYFMSDSKTWVKTPCCLKRRVIHSDITVSLLIYYSYSSALCHSLLIDMKVIYVDVNRRDLSFRLGVLKLFERTSVLYRSS